MARRRRHLSGPSEDAQILWTYVLLHVLFGATTGLIAGMNLQTARRGAMFGATYSGLLFGLRYAPQLPTSSAVLLFVVGGAGALGLFADKLPPDATIDRRTPAPPSVPPQSESGRGGGGSLPPRAEVWT